MHDPGDVDETTEPFTTQANGFPQTTVEEFQVNADSILTRLRALLEAGKVRKVVLKTEAGRPLLTVPLTAGMAGGALGLVLGPVFTLGVVAVALLAARLTISVEKSVD